MSGSSVSSSIETYLSRFVSTAMSIHQSLDPFCKSKALHLFPNTPCMYKVFSFSNCILKMQDFWIERPQKGASASRRECLNDSNTDSVSLEYHEVCVLKIRNHYSMIHKLMCLGLPVRTDRASS